MFKKTPLVNVAGNLVNLSKVLNVTKDNLTIKFMYDTGNLFEITFENIRDLEYAWKQLGK